MSDEYRDHPPSVTEIKATKSSNGTLWLPRDALISVLRDIDNGQLVDALVVAYRIRRLDDPSDPGTVWFAQACPDPTTAVGVLELAKMRLVRVI